MGDVENPGCGENRYFVCPAYRVGKEYKYKNTSAPEFSKDSQFIVFSEPAGENAAAGIAYQVKLVCLAKWGINFPGNGKFYFYQ